MGNTKYTRVGNSSEYIDRSSLRQFDSQSFQTQSNKQYSYRMKKMITSRRIYFILSSGLITALCILSLAGSNNCGSIGNAQCVDHPCGNDPGVPNPDYRVGAVGTQGNGLRWLIPPTDEYLKVKKSAGWTTGNGGVQIGNGTCIDYYDGPACFLGPKPRLHDTEDECYDTTPDQ